MTGTNVPIDPPPPENPVDKPAVKKPLQRAVTERPFVPNHAVDLKPTTDTIIGGTIPNAMDGYKVEPFDPGIAESHTPVLTAVAIDPRYMRDFQPDYPPAMQRAQEEGKVTVRVNIGADGRVTAIEKLFATSDAFWEAARKQALAKWRFRAATRDGAPVESEKVMTVHFTLT
ncbi:energy transducer TonB [Sphingobium sp. SCG-1]|nr:energy transducer TonB [Sphingobium sp. SCG-1]